MRQLSRPKTKEEQSRRMSRCARVVLAPVAVIGAVLSWRSLYEAAVPTFGTRYAVGFPLLVDLLILGASLQYVAGTQIGRPVHGWRLTAHAGVFGTLTLNALAAEHLERVPWHVTAPAVWAVLVELAAKQVRGEWAASQIAETDPISLTLWLTAPIESARTRLLMLRMGIRAAPSARAAVGVHTAAREVLRLAFPNRRGRRTRKVISRQLRAGSLPPAALLSPLDWAGTHPALLTSRPESILRAVLLGVLDPSASKQQGSQHLSAVPTLKLSDDDPGPAADNGPDDGVSNDSGDHDVDGHERSEQRFTNQSAENRPLKRQRRLADAVEITRRRTTITGPELRIALAAKGWQVSERTAVRILSAARDENAVHLTQARMHE